MGLILIGKMKQALKSFHELGASTAVTLRLAQPWGGSGRVVVADSAFSSVQTLVQMKSKLGLNFMGMVKTAHRRFPKKFLNECYETDWDPDPRRSIGSW